MHCAVQDPDARRKDIDALARLDRNSARCESDPWAVFSFLSMPNRASLGFCMALSYAPFPQRKDGFIHLSTAHQLAGTLKRFFAKGTHGIGDELSLLGLPRSQLPDPAALKFEPAAGTLFGHVYGVRREAREEDGVHWISTCSLMLLSFPLQPIDPATAFVQEYKLQRGTDGVFPLESLPY